MSWTIYDFVNFLARKHDYRRTPEFFEELKECISIEVTDRAIRAKRKSQANIFAEVWQEANVALSRVFTSYNAAKAVT